MKLKVPNKIGGGLLILLLLLMIMSCFLALEGTNITYTKIIAVIINIMVMVIVISLLVCQKESKSVCEFMANLGKMRDHH